MKGHMASWRAAASAPRAPRSELALMKAIGRKVIFTLPLLTYFETSCGTTSSEASLQNGQEVSPYSTTRIGAPGRPMVSPDCGMPASSFFTVATPSIEVVLSLPPITLTTTTTTTTTIARPIAPKIHLLSTRQPPPVRFHPHRTRRR
jgi:hypothetical protein